ncbi:MAG: TolC family protein [Bacteroidales bacterium]|nr:TolC family protein [Bacteroidales bacterium]
MNFKKILYLLISSLLLSTTIFSQHTLTIGVSKDANTLEFQKFSKLLKSEISGLIEAKYTVRFIELNAEWNPSEIHQNNIKLMNDSGVDIVITLGYISSTDISKLKNFTKPVIAANILDENLQKLPLKSHNETGIKNFTYIESIIRLKEDLQTFIKIFKVNRAAVFIPRVFQENFPQITDYLKQNIKDADLNFVAVDKKSEGAIAELPVNTDAAIILPLIKFPRTEVVYLLDTLNKMGIPTLAVSGVDYLNLGASITMTPQFSFQQLARQLALRVLKITEGVNPSEISVSIEDTKRVPIINMSSLRETGKFPEWNVINEAILLNATNFPTGREVNLRMAIAEALQNNLQSKISEQDVLISEQDVRIAKSNIMPQISIGGSTVWLSDNLVEASMGQKGSFTLTGSASLKQVIFSESAFANITINKLMAENKKYFDEQATLDVVTHVSGAYIALLFSKSNLLIQNENINATIQNLQMAKAKEEAGQAGVSDINRWITELNLNKMKFNDAYTAFRNNMYELNKQLNSPIDMSFNIPDSNSIDKAIILEQEILDVIFKNPLLTERYASFVINEMKKNSPELQQLASMAKIIQRKTALYKKQWYMPEIALVAGADQAFVRDGIIPPPNMPVPQPPDDMTFNAGISLKIPIFQGGKSSAETKKSMLEMDKINYQKEDVMNQLEAGIRSSVQRLRTSFLELELSKNAAQAAESNFKMVQDAYFQGAVNLIQLIDAQNVMIKTKNMANIAYYQYVIDYIQVQRLQGKFVFLSSNEEQQNYSANLREFILKK